MSWTELNGKTAGAALLISVVLVIVNAALITVVVGDADPTARGDIENILIDINDKQALYFTGVAFSIATDAVALLAVGAALYLLFKDRSRMLALFGFAGFLGAGLVFFAADIANLALGVLATDFVEQGGAGALAAGDPAILQTARAVGIIQGLSELAGQTPLAFGLLSLGALLAWAPDALVNPPRWLGALPLLSGAALLLSWTYAASAGVGLAFASIGLIGSLLFLVILGGWLLVQPERQAAAA